MDQFEEGLSVAGFYVAEFYVPGFQGVEDVRETVVGWDFQVTGLQVFVGKFELFFVDYYLFLDDSLLRAVFYGIQVAVEIFDIQEILLILQGLFNIL